MMRLRSPGIVVLLLAASAGCAGTQSRVSWPSQGAGELGQNRVTTWFKSRPWARQTSEPPSVAVVDADTDANAGLRSRAQETARHASPETEIWPTQRTTRFPRLFTWLGRHGFGVNSESAQDVGRGITMSGGASHYGDPWLDREVKPTAGEQPSPRNLAKTKELVEPAARLYDPPQPQGNVALEIAPDDPSFPTDSSDATATLEPRLGTAGRADDPFVKVTADSGDSAVETSQQPGGRPTNPPPPVESRPAVRPAAPEPTPTPAPAQGTRAPRPAPVPEPSPTPAPAAPATMPTPAPSQATEPTPTAEPGPGRAAEPASAAQVTPATEVSAQAPQAPAPQAAPAGQFMAPVLAPSMQGVPSGLVSPSPQCNSGAPCKPAPKKCFLLTWLHGLRTKHPKCNGSCQLPTLAYPTSYYECLPKSKPSCLTQPGAVLASPQCGPAPGPAPCAPAKPKKKCWLHKGMIAEFFSGLKSWGCACSCHATPTKHSPKGCKPCGGHAHPWASPQAAPAGPAPAGLFSHASLSPEAGDIAEGRGLLDRIAANGLNESPQR